MDITEDDFIDVKPQFLTCLIPGNYIITGFSGKKYEFTESKRTLLVNAVDVEYFLTKRTKGGCCGCKKEGQPMFQLA